MSTTYFRILKSLRSVLAMIVITVLALYVYWHQQRSDRQHATDESAIIRAQTRELQAQAAQMTQQLQSVSAEAQALRAEMDRQRESVERGKAQEVRAKTDEPATTLQLK
jgi:hypothetical protein